MQKYFSKSMLIFIILFLNFEQSKKSINDWFYNNVFFYIRTHRMTQVFEIMLQ